MLEGKEDAHVAARGIERPDERDEQERPEVGHDREAEPGRAHEACCRDEQRPVVKPVRMQSHGERKEARAEEGHRGDDDLMVRDEAHLFHVEKARGPVVNAVRLDAIGIEGQQFGIAEAIEVHRAHDDPDPALDVAHAPLAGVVPAQATAPALIVVGYLMSRLVREIPFDDFEEGFPALLTLTMMAFTYSITNGFEPAYPFGLHKNAAGFFLTCASLLLVVAPNEFRSGAVEIKEFRRNAVDGG